MTEIIQKRAKEIWAHQGFQRYFKNTGWMFFGQMISLLVSFFISAWIARYLGPEDYGVMNYAIAFASLFSFIASFGIDGILNRELIKFPEKRDELLGTSFYLKIIGGIISFVLCAIIAFLFKINLLTRLLIILFSFTFVLQAINVINIYFQSEVKSKNNVKVQLFAVLISSILKISVILLGKGVIWIIAVYVLDFVWQGIGFLSVYKICGLKIGKWQFNKFLAEKILKNSWPLMLASAAGTVYLKIDQVIIGFLMSNYEVGLYAAAVKLVEVWNFVPVIICSSLFPAIINAKKTSNILYQHRLRNLYFLMLATSIVILIPMLFLAKPIIYLFFGASYLESVSILRVYIWSIISFFLSTAVSQYLMSENLVKKMFWLNLLAMVSNIFLNFIFIPIFGLLGAAWATLISYSIIPIIVFTTKVKDNNHLYSNSKKYENINSSF